MTFKFEALDVWSLSLEYVDGVYRAVKYLPREEEYNLKSQWIRAATSIALNIAEGSTGQSDSEQSRFLGFSIRSLMECVACLRIAQLQGYFPVEEPIAFLEERSLILAKKLQAFRKQLVNRNAVGG